MIMMPHPAPAWSLPCSAPSARLAFCHVRAAGRSRTRATGRSSPDTLVSLPLFPLPSVLHPGDSGTITVYEPRYLCLFQDLQTSTPPGEEPRFLHLLAPAAAPPALMDSAVGGVPQLGVCAAAKAIRPGEGGTLVVSYTGQRRLRLRAVEAGQRPYLVGAGSWFDDAVGGEDARAECADLERRVLQALLAVARYSRALGLSDGTLPPAVLRYSPPPAPAPTGGTLVTQDAARPAAGDAAMWRRHGSVYGAPAPTRLPASDPYLTLREQLGRDQRQEMFSFAAASLLQMGLPERLALLQCADTRARLGYVDAALAPYLAELVARAAVRGAVGP